MKKLFSILLLLPFVTHGQSTDENYVVTKVYKQAKTSAVIGNNKDEVMTSVAYFDGLGRLKQTVAVNAGGNTVSNNAIPIDWTLNATATDFFNRNGESTENRIVSGATPFGGTDLLWECIPDAASGADGGWNTDYFTIDNTKTYRYSVWVKKNKRGYGKGRAYHGTGSVDNLDGTASGNPYFWSGDLPQANTWYVLVGVVHPYTYRGTDTGVSGVYDTNGNKISDGIEFRWRENVSTTRLRNYLFYCTNTSVRQYFWSPLFQAVDGGELPLEDVFSEDTPVIARETIKDIVTHVEYDELGRMAKEYLPVTHGSGNAGIRTENMALATREYYGRKYAKDFAGVPLPTAINAYSEKEYDNSPLNRVIQQAAPGYDWRLGGGHEIKFDYKANGANEVKLYKVTTNFANNTYTPTLGKTSYYAAGTLFKTVTKDENWKESQAYANDHTTEEFKNKSGQVVLKRTYNQNQPHDTYYVYDDHGNLTYVLPPKVNSTDGISATELSELCYQYVYDYRNRLVKKKIPGKGWEYIVYDKLDRPVLTQDANLKSKKQWLFTKYDRLGRVVYTGKYTHSTAIDQATMQAHFDTQNSSSVNMYETKLTTVGVQSSYYSNTNFPHTGIEILTVNYYDNYTFDRAGANLTESAYGVDATTRLQGLATGTKVKVLNTINWITTVTYYDEKARPIYVYTKNGYLQTTDIVESKLDDFTGKVLETTTTHKKTGKADVVIIDRFEYDHMDRLISQNQQINNQISERIVKNNYDDLGQLESKILGNGTQSGYKDVTNGLSVVGNEITKTGVSNEWDTGLATLGNINGDGYVEAIIPVDTKDVMIGVSTANTTASFTDMNYAVYCNHLGELKVYESSVNKGVKSTYAPGDQIAIERIGNTMYYKKNGVTFYVSETRSSGSLLGDLSMHNNGAKIKDFKIVDNSKGLQKVDYSYNVRGWLTNINDDMVNDNDLFNFSLKYNDPSVELNKRLYNGNIAQTSWQTQNVDNTRKTYNYLYDALNRITHATGASTTNYDVSGITYDKNGNILTLQRKGHINSEATLFDIMDDLSYTYGSGNRLLKVTDTGNTTYGFKEDINGNQANNFNIGITNNFNIDIISILYNLLEMLIGLIFTEPDTPETDYTYDANGNMTADKNKGITNIAYNHLNLPTSVTINGKNIDYVYDATGNKLAKKVFLYGSPTITYYAGNYVYEQPPTSRGQSPVINLQFFNHPEGYVKADVTSSGVEMDYVYQYKDHLGNVRLSYIDANKDGQITQNEIIEESHYYPFGLKHKGYNNTVNSLGNSTAQKWDYLGQERQEELGLNWLTFRHRNYMPDIGRFFGVDPVSEDYMSISTYQFAHNNPIWKIELEGLEGVETTGTDIINKEKIKFFNPKIQPVGTIFRGSATIKGAFKSGGTGSISLGKQYKGELSMSVVEGKAKVNTNKELKLSGKAFSISGVIEAPGVGKVKGNASALGLGFKANQKDGIAIDKVSLGTFGTEASQENGNTMGIETSLAKVDAEGNEDYLSVNKVKAGNNNSLTGVLAGNTIGVGGKVGKVTLAGSIDLTEAKKAVSNFFNRLYDLIINGPQKPDNAK